MATLAGMATEELLAPTLNENGNENENERFSTGTQDYGECHSPLACRSPLACPVQHTTVPVCLLTSADYKQTNNYQIIMGLANIKNLKLNCSISSSYFAQGGWTPDLDRYAGVISGWVKKSNEIILVLFEGDVRASRHELNMLLDPQFEFRLEAFDDGPLMEGTMIPNKCSSASRLILILGGKESGVSRARIAYSH